MERVNNERGSAIVLVVAALVALLGFAALTIDVGILYVNHQRLSNATDAAALAAVQVLNSNPTDVTAAENTARDYAIKNGLQSDEVSVAVYGSEKRIKIDTRRQVDFFLAPILGLSNTKVCAEAQARVGAVEEVYGVVPLGVRRDEFNYGEEYLLHYDSHGGKQGNFGGLAMPGGTGKNWYRDNLSTGYAGWLQIGQEIWTEPGVGSGPTEQGLGPRFDGHEGCTLENHEKNCPRLVACPIIDSDEDLKGRTLVEIVGFATFFLKEEPDHGEIVGYFVETLISSGAQGIDGNDFGLRAAKLVK